jgi:hypothetical protein
MMWEQKEIPNGKKLALCAVKPGDWSDGRTRAINLALDEAIMSTFFIKN